ncbi:hypothetical protein SATMO3_40060 [Sporomusa aerivorans]
MEWLALSIPILAAAWVYSDAKSCGSSSPKLWAIGVFGLLIIFLPLYFIMRPSKKSRVVKLCPYCGKYYKGIPTFCPNCGKHLQGIK